MPRSNKGVANKMLSYFTAAACVIGLAIGQLLFKYCAASLHGGESYFNLKAAGFFVLAISIYAIASVAWVFVLQREELGRVYPLMAIAFILVPLGSHYFFGEQFHAQYLVGVVLIVGGVIAATSA
jgi:drug/metabolite transporter (DMT)-like permease